MTMIVDHVSLYPLCAIVYIHKAKSMNITEVLRCFLPMKKRHLIKYLFPVLKTSYFTVTHIQWCYLSQLNHNDAKPLNK